jgi:hypothetical protein
MTGFGSGAEPALGGAAIRGQIVTAVIDRAERKHGDGKRRGIVETSFDRALTRADILLCEALSVCGDTALPLHMNNLPQAQLSDRQRNMVHVQAQFIEQVLGQFIGDLIKESAYRSH